MTKLDELKKDLLSWPDKTPPNRNYLSIVEQKPQKQHTDIEKQQQIFDYKVYYCLTQEEAELLYNRTFNPDFIFKNKINA
jgi:hypothetical protein